MKDSRNEWFRVARSSQLIQHHLQTNKCREAKIRYCVLCDEIYGRWVASGAAQTDTTLIKRKLAGICGPQRPHLAIPRCFCSLLAVWHLERKSLKSSHLIAATRKSKQCCWPRAECLGCLLWWPYVGVRDLCAIYRPRPSQAHHCGVFPTWTRM